MSFNLSATKQIYIPLSKPGGFDSLEAAKAHRQVVGKATELRNSAQEAIDGLKSEDRVGFSSTPSDDWVDLSPKEGHVVMVGEKEEGPVGLELSFNPTTGRTNSFVADDPAGKLTQGSDPAQSGISPTYKWEETVDGQPQTTYFKFDDNNGVLTILDPNNQEPAILGGVEPGKVEGGIILNPMPILQF